MNIFMLMVCTVKSVGGLQNRLTSELAGLTGGARGKANDNDNGNGKHKQEQQKEKPPEHSVFKYSSRFRGPLHESIMIGCEPFFLTYSEANGHLGLVRQIEDNDRILSPHLSKSIRTNLSSLVLKERLKIMKEWR